jgi:hypothetical protein
VIVVSNIGFIRKLQKIEPRFINQGKNFLMNINNFQVLAILKQGVYDVDIMDNYHIFKTWHVDEEDILYFLIYFKMKTMRKNKNG